MRPGPRLVTVTVDGWLHPTTPYKDGHCAPTEEAVWPRGAPQVHTFLGGTVQLLESLFIYFHFISGGALKWKCGGVDVASWTQINGPNPCPGQ